MTLLIFLGVFASAMLGYAIKSNSKVQKYLDKSTRKEYLPKAISMLVLTVQFGELIKAVEHTNFVSVTSAIMLLVIVIATKKSGSEEI
jgi:hypothetical protein